MALKEGTVVAGRYALHRLLGEGGMGAVWSATNEITGGRVALKFIRHALADPEGLLRQRLLREARAAARIEHPNVLGVRDVVEHDGMPVIVMDLLQGETLAERLSRLGRLEVGDASRILLAVIAGVGAAHEVGLIHRDLKPENVFVAKTPTGEVVRVLDFGIAKSVRVDEPENGITASGALVGTPAYMAPEQLFGEKVLDHRVDVWAIGALLYEALVGQRFVTGENYGQIAKELLSPSRPSLAAKCPDVPADIAGLVERMLARERDERLADLREAAEILARHAALPSPTFGAPRARPIVDSDPDARVVVSGRANPSAPTIDLGTDPRDARPTSPKSETAVARTGSGVPNPPSRMPWLVAGVVVLVASGFAVRALTSSSSAVDTGTPTPPSTSVPSTSASAPTSVTATAMTNAPAPVSASVPPAASSAPVAIASVSEKKPSIGVLPKVPTSSTATAATTISTPTVTTVAVTASVAPPPPTPSASGTGGGLVKKPPF